MMTPEPVRPEDTRRLEKGIFYTLIFTIVLAFIAMAAISFFSWPRETRRVKKTLAEEEILREKAKLVREYETLGALVARYNPTLTPAERYLIGEAVHTYSLRAGLDPLLVVSIIGVESSGDIYAMSPMGARGLMQIMPEWDERLGIEGDIFAIETNIEAGVRILAGNIQQWGLKEGVLRYCHGMGDISGSLYYARVAREWKRLRA